MKTSNDWENRMPTWTPRPPSERLVGSLFGSRPSEPAPEPAVLLRLRWAEATLRQLAVGLTCGVALLVMLHTGEGEAAPRHWVDPGPFILLSALSNQQSAAYHSPHVHSGWNHCDRPLLEWTNPLPIASTIPSFPGRKLN